MNKPYLLLIDLGTSGPKVALANTSAQILATHFETVKYKVLPAGGVESSPALWWDAIKIGIKSVLAQFPQAANNVISISTTAMFSGTVAIDKDDRPLMDGIIWMDTRGAPHIKKLTNGFPKVSGYSLKKLSYWLKVAGGVPGHSGKDSIGHILYIKNERADIYDKTAMFLEPKDYINFLFTGVKATSSETMTLHWVTDNRNLPLVKYDDKLLNYVGVPKDKFPKIYRATDIIGTLKSDVAKELGLPTGIKVIAGTPDITSSALGAGTVKDYDVQLYTGTSSWLGCHVNFKKVNIGLNLASIPSALPDKYIVIAEQEVGGESLKYLRDNILYPKDELKSGPAPGNYFELINKIAADVPAGSHGLIFTPWLCGERLPVEDPYVRGGFYNQTLNTTRSHMIRSVFEGVTFHTNWLKQSLEKFNKRKIGQINAIGGGALSDLWCQIKADILDCQINQMNDPVNAGLKGLAWLTLVALDMADFNTVPTSISIKQKFTPKQQHRETYDELFGHFKSIYHNNKKTYKKLNEIRL